MTNSADPDQLASSEANWSGSALFAKTGHVVFSKRRVNSFPASGNFCHLLITFANSLDQDQARQNVGPDLGPNCLTLWWYSWKNFFERVNFKENPQTTKKHAKLLSMQRVNCESFTHDCSKGTHNFYNSERFSTGKQYVICLSETCNCLWSLSYQVQKHGDNNESCHIYRLQCVK